jgi:hypothetical protein
MVRYYIVVELRAFVAKMRKLENLVERGFLAHTDFDCGKISVNIFLKKMSDGLVHRRTDFDQEAIYILNIRYSLPPGFYFYFL